MGLGSCQGYTERDTEKRDHSKFRPRIQIGDKWSTWISGSCVMPRADSVKHNSGLLLLNEVGSVPTPDNSFTVADLEKM